MEWSNLAYVLRSPNALKILNALKEKPLTPKEIAKRINMDSANVSTKLRGLMDRGLIECLNPQDSMFRLYSITDKGRTTLKEAESR